MFCLSQAPAGSDGQQSRLTAVVKRQGLSHRLRVWPKKRRVKTRLRIYSLNLGTMTVKSRERAEMLDRRKIDIACVQETKWKESQAREIRDGYKHFYHWEKTSRTGVGIIVSQKWKDKHNNIIVQLPNGVLGAKRVLRSGKRLLWIMLHGHVLKSNPPGGTFEEIFLQPKQNGHHTQFVISH